jgi:hypothetical protein
MQLEITKSSSVSSEAFLQEITLLNNKILKMFPCKEIAISTTERELN